MARYFTCDRVCTWFSHSENCIDLRRRERGPRDLVDPIKPFPSPENPGIIKGQETQQP